VKRTLAALALVAAVSVAVALAETKPDPNVQAAPDGCQRNGTAIYTGFAPNWVYVGDAKTPADGPPPPPRWASGAVQSNEDPALASRVATSDDPITHRSFDLNVDVRVDPGTAFLTGASRDGTPQQDHLHLERESGSIPTFAWPTAGDRVSALGSWVWDCDHFGGLGEKTEFHPFRALWVARTPGRPRTARAETEGDLFVSTDGTAAGAQADCAHRTKGSAAYKDCAHSASSWQDVNGDYSFDLSPPPRPSKTAHLVVRVVDRGSVAAPRVNAVFNDAVVRVSFTVAAAGGKNVVVAKQVFAGWQEAKPPVHLRLRFDRVLIRRAMDPSCRPDQPACLAKNESTLLGQIAAAPGEWQITWNVAGNWGAWQPRTLLAHDGQSFRGRQTVDFWVLSGQPWTLAVQARECDFGALPSFSGPGHSLSPCPRTNEVGNATGDDYAGAVIARFASAERSLGRHATNASTAGSTCPASNVNGCYQLTYTVSRAR
jgi:hypothetical protein